MTFKKGDFCHVSMLISSLISFSPINQKSDINLKSITSQDKTIKSSDYMISYWEIKYILKIINRGSLNLKVLKFIIAGEFILL